MHLSPVCVGMVQEGTSVHTSGSQRTTLNGVPQEVSTLILETGSLIWSDTHQSRLGWLGRWLQGPTCVGFPSTGVIDIQPKAQHFTSVLGTDWGPHAYFTNQSISTACPTSLFLFACVHSEVNSLLC